MVKLNSHPAGRHFLQIPGPSTVPDRILRAMDYPTIDHRGPEFQALGKKVLADIRKIFQTKNPVVIYPASGTGAWEAALVNTLSPGDTVLMYETGHFATLWKKMADKLGINPEFIGDDWRRGADAARIEARLVADTEHKIKAVCVVHNETSTGVTSDIAAVRRAMDRAKHPALLLVDTISSLGSIDYRHDEWGVDVTVSGSQKGLMLPPGISFNAVSDKAIAASREARLPKAYWGWDEILEANKNGFWPYTPATNLLYGLSEACDMLLEEGLENVFARHQRHAAATRAAVEAWGLEILCQNPAEYSGVLTGVVMPKDASGQYYNADAFRKAVLENFNMSLGQGLSKLSGWVFRIGHLGDFNDLTLMGTLAGVEMGFEVAGIPHRKGGVLAAMQYLTATSPQGKQAETLAKAA
ncbi:serine--glyoxylate aminotransferase [Massilia sp. WF1]|uniref:pyridoxal-phosphate-dependent aminotransferase family protein n=1 Tax=unclassified Massilia TaxID=2609279 RepID=UPI00064B0661|nr:MULTISPECIES: aminotransferase class V-fold PLP-dependent enzyme [unclassified Massilia]ALK97562.1 serine--glyoxylate aminotransferase [Massilia sp. WG5]KLU35981.1 serine--glyoxylate aminotransferase [Massilia sp. WF1]